MWTFLILLIVAAWVFTDAKKRKADSPGAWAFGTILLAIVAVPVYLASRPLIGSERREGGKAWNVLRYLALCWTLVMAVLGVWGFFSALDAFPTYGSDAEKAGGTIGMMLGLFFVGILWAVPTGIALLIGVLVRKPNLVETAAGAIRTETSPAAPLGTKRCPFCAETIQSAAILCRFCGRDLPQTSPTPSGDPVPLAALAIAASAPAEAAPAPVVPRGSTWKALAVIGAGLGVLILIGAMLNPSTARRSTTTQASEPVEVPIRSLYPRPIITLTQYQALQEGMTYGDAVTAFGRQGYEIARGTGADLATITFRWDDGRGSGHLDATFQSNRLTVKTQTGLR